MQRRRLLLASGLAAATPALWPAAARAAGPLKIGFVYPGPIADIGWTYPHDLGRKMVEKEFGSHVQTLHVEKVPE